MRDPNRIPRILEKLRIVWEYAPDLRLGQLVENAKLASPHHNIDTFSAEDDQVEKGLDWFIKNMVKKQPEPTANTVEAALEECKKWKMSDEKLEELLK
jgi:hypothetical protein